MVSESASQDQSGSFFLLASLFDCSSCNLFFFLSLSTDIHTPCHSHINQSTRVFLAFGAFVAAIIFLLVQDTTSTVRLYAPTSGSVVVLVTFIYYYSFSPLQLEPRYNSSCVCQLEVGTDDDCGALLHCLAYCDSSL